MSTGSITWLANIVSCYFKIPCWTICLTTIFYKETIVWTCSTPITALSRTFFTTWVACLAKTWDFVITILTCRTLLHTNMCLNVQEFIRVASFTLIIISFKASSASRMTAGTFIYCNIIEISIWTTWYTLAIHVESWYVACYTLIYRTTWACQTC